jgi:hypothetical protein
MQIKHLLRLILAILFILILIYIFRLYKDSVYNLIPFIYTIIKLSTIQFLLILLTTLLSLLFGPNNLNYLSGDEDVDNSVNIDDYHQPLEYTLGSSISHANGNTLEPCSPASASNIKLEDIPIMDSNQNELEDVQVLEENKQIIKEFKRLSPIEKDMKLIELKLELNKTDLEDIDTIDQITHEIAIYSAIIDIDKRQSRNIELSTYYDPSIHTLQQYKGSHFKEMPLESLIILSDELTILINKMKNDKDELVGEDKLDFKRKNKYLFCFFRQSREID